MSAHIPCLSYVASFTFDFGKMGEMHHWPADPALHLLLEKAPVIFYGPYLQIACSHVDSLLLAHLKAFSPT